LQLARPLRKAKLQPTFLERPGFGGFGGFGDGFGAGFGGCLLMLLGWCFWWWSWWLFLVTASPRRRGRISFSAHVMRVLEKFAHHL